MMSRLGQWAIPAILMDGWHAFKVTGESDSEQTVMLDSPHGLLSVPMCGVVAWHATKEEAEAAVKRAKDAELSVRPFWQEAVAMEHRFRTIMQEAAFAAAQPPNSFN